MTKSLVSSPGKPKMYSTCSSSKHFTNKSDAFIYQFLMQYVSLIEYLSGPCQEGPFAISEIHNYTSNLVFICRLIIAGLSTQIDSAEQFFNETCERCYNILRSAPTYTPLIISTIGNQIDNLVSIIPRRRLGC